MIVQCSDCRTRYQLDPDRVPAAQIRVRCPKCASVFFIDGARPAARVEMPLASAPPPRPEPTPAAPPRPEPVQAVPDPEPMPTPSQPYGEIELDSTPVPTPSPAASVERPSMPESGPAALEMDLEIERASSIDPIASAPASAPRPGAGFASEMGSATGAGAATATAAPPKPAAAPAANPTDDKARRLARALVSDILVYNRDARDKSLSEGNLVQVMGQEIKKSWEMYKEKVTPEVANSTNHFREALNEILANGQQIF